MPHEPARLINAAAAVLAAGVVTDSTAEHYRAGFHKRAMWIAPVVGSAALVTALRATAGPRRHRESREAVFAASLATGVAGFLFHLKNVSQRPGGWNSSNVFYGAPMAAPLAAAMAGLLGLAGSRLATDDGAPSIRLARAVGILSAVGLLGTSIEAAALQFRGAFQNPFMYAPVTLPPGVALSNRWRSQSVTHHSGAGVPDRGPHRSHGEERRAELSDRPRRL